MQDRIWDEIREDASERTAVVARDVERHERRLKSLTDNQARLVQMSYRGLVSDELLAQEQQRLDTEKQQASTLLEQARLQETDIAETLKVALGRTTGAYEKYSASSPLERRLLNQTFFRRLLIGEDSEVVGSDADAHLRIPCRLGASTRATTAGRPARGA